MVYKKYSLFLLLALAFNQSANAIGGKESSYSAEKMVIIILL